MAKRALHVTLRPGFAICLFLSQFTASRSSLFTGNPYVLILGIIVLIAGILLLVSASSHLHKALDAGETATDGPFKYVRHPIYVSIYVISIGLGLIFFAWLWFVVLLVFLPLWWLECREEEKELLRLYGEIYLAYQSKTGMFLPKVVW